MKKLGLLVAILFVATSLFAYDFYVDGLCYNITNNAEPYTVEVTYQDVWSSGNNYSNLTEVIIPSTVTYNGKIYNVTSIGQWAFADCQNLSSVSISEGVKSIGNRAFSACSNITTLIIPNSVTTIGECAFWACTAIASIDIPNSVIAIDPTAFASDNNVVYTGTATGAPWGAKCLNGYVEGYVVYDSEAKNKLLGCSTAVEGEIIIPNSVTTIGCNAFQSCLNLSSVIMPNSVTYIESGAFSYCYGLTSISLSTNLSAIEGNAFLLCHGLNTIVIPESVMGIGANAFYYVNNIEYTGTAIGSPWGAKSRNGYVEDYLVYESEAKTQLLGCSSAATGEICIPESVTAIGNKAFNRCNRITSVTLPNSVESIGNYAFENCSNLTTVNLSNGLIMIGYYAFANCINLNAISIPNSVLDIEDDAFSECSSLTSIILPNSIIKINKSVFAGCSNLTSVTIPNSVVNVESWAFYGCTNLANIIISENATSIGERTFYNCTNLTSLIIPDNVTSIGNSTFGNCMNLNSVTIGSSVTSIGGFAFEGCAALKEIISKNVTPPTVNWSTFEELDKTIPVYVPDESLTDYKNAPYWNEFNIIGNSTGVDNISDSDIPIVEKFFRNGQVLIRRGDRVYTVTGQEVKK